MCTFLHAHGYMHVCIYIFSVHACASKFATPPAPDISLPRDDPWHRPVLHLWCAFRRRGINLSTILFCSLSTICCIDHQIQKCLLCLVPRMAQVVWPAPRKTLSSRAISHVLLKTRLRRLKPWMDPARCIHCNVLRQANTGNHCAVSRLMHSGSVACLAGSRRTPWDRRLSALDPAAGNSTPGKGMKLKKHHSCRESMFAHRELLISASWAGRRCSGVRRVRENT